MPYISKLIYPVTRVHPYGKHNLLGFIPAYENYNIKHICYKHIKIRWTKHADLTNSNKTHFCKYCMNRIYKSCLIYYKHHPGEGLWNMKHVFINNVKCQEKLDVNDIFFYRSFTESSTITWHKNCCLYLLWLTTWISFLAKTLV